MPTCKSDIFGKIRPHSVLFFVAACIFAPFSHYPCHNFPRNKPPTPHWLRRPTFLEYCFSTSENLDMLNNAKSDFLKSVCTFHCKCTIKFIRRTTTLMKNRLDEKFSTPKMADEPFRVIIGGSVLARQRTCSNG